MPRTVDPVRRLPPPVQVHAHIGRLLRELRVARRLFKLSKAAAEMSTGMQPADGGKEAANAR